MSALSRKEHKAMQVLMAACRPLYGLDVVEHSNGILGKGTVYVTLSRLEGRGYLQSEQVMADVGAGLIPRRLYTITTVGARAYWASPVPAPKRWWQFWR